MAANRKEFIRCCPFCGSHEVAVLRTNPYACWVACTVCGGNSEPARTRKAAIARWNRRYFDDTPSTISMDHDVERRWRTDPND